MIRIAIGFASISVLAVGCASDPQYITPATGQTFSMEYDGSAQEAPPPVMVQLPFRLETEQEVMERNELATELMFAADQIPFVRLEDVDLSIEWSIKNLNADCDAKAVFDINGGNQYFAYDPGQFADPDDPEAMVPPPLLGYVAPTPVPGGAVVTGVFREDQIREAAIDIELITRANVNPFKALLEVNKNITEMPILTPIVIVDDEPQPQTETGMFVPPEAWAQLIQFSISFSARNGDEVPEGCSPHLVMEWNFRARDQRGVLHDEGLDADPAELSVWTPTVFAPMFMP
jgi:hypothetical protein